MMRSMSHQQDTGARPDWVGEAEQALERATEAIRSAWNQTRDSRMAALVSAREAVEQLGEAIDRGVVAARTTWQTSESEQSSSGEEAAPKQQSGAGEEE